MSPSSHNRKIGILDKDARIYVAGHKGLVGSALTRKLKEEKYTNFILRSHGQLDLTCQSKVKSFFEKENPEFVFLAAAKVGGILANQDYPAEFIYQNLMIQMNIIHQSYVNSVKKLLFLGSSCIYPKFAQQPLKEDALLTGSLEPTNEPYAIAKIAGIKMCDSYRKQYGMRFISAMPTNLYGTNDNFDLQTSHVLPALIRKIHEAKIEDKKSFTLWGTGEPRREFLFIDNLAEALIFLMKNWDEPGPINVGTGKDISILELVNLIAEIVEFKGDIKHDLSKPDGTPQKLLDISRISKLGWQPKTDLRTGIIETYEWFKNNFYKKKKNRLLITRKMSSTNE